MNKLKHTPGPWEKDYGATLHHIKATNDKRGTPTVCKYNDSFKSGGPLIVADSLIDEEREANGLIIAAAPEMLEMLIRVYRNMCEDCDTKTSYCDYGKSTCTLKYDMKNLVEKATGMSIEEVLKDE